MLCAAGSCIFFKFTGSRIVLIRCFCFFCGGRYWISFIVIDIGLRRLPNQTDAIKPSNICWEKSIKGNFSEITSFYLIDFGYSKHLFDTKDDHLDSKLERESNKVHYQDKKKYF